MKNISKMTKAELIEELKGQVVELESTREINNNLSSERDNLIDENHNLRVEMHSLQLNYDMLKSNYDGVEEENQRLNDKALELDAKVKASAEEIVNLTKEKQSFINKIELLHTVNSNLSEKIIEKETQLKRAGKVNKSIFASLILVLIVWIVTLIQFAI